MRPTDLRHALHRTYYALKIGAPIPVLFLYNEPPAMAAVKGFRMLVLTFFRTSAPNDGAPAPAAACSYLSRSTGMCKRRVPFHRRRSPAGFTKRRPAGQWEALPHRTQRQGIPPQLCCLGWLEGSGHVGCILCRIDVRTNTFTTTEKYRDRLESPRFQSQGTKFR